MRGGKIPLPSTWEWWRPSSGSRFCVLPALGSKLITRARVILSSELASIHPAAVAGRSAALDPLRPPGSRRTSPADCQCLMWHGDISRHQIRREWNSTGLAIRAPPAASHQGRSHLRDHVTSRARRRAARSRSRSASPVVPAAVRRQRRRRLSVLTFLPLSNLLTFSIQLGVPMYPIPTGRNSSSRIEIFPNRSVKQRPFRETEGADSKTQAGMSELASAQTKRARWQPHICYSVRACLRTFRLSPTPSERPLSSQSPYPIAKAILARFARGPGRRGG